MLPPIWITLPNVTISQTIEMGGKRSRRVAVAESSFLTAAATLDDFFRTLRGTAASAFIDAVADRMIAAQKRNSYEALLAQANRYPDLTVGVQFAQTTASTNPINPSPTFNSTNLSVSIPLPLFNSYRGEYEAAVKTASQSETTLKSVTLKAEVDVRTNFKRYQLAKARLAQYQGAAL